jgi:RNA polymerase sigma-70 factor (ECF subfamily)
MLTWLLTITRNRCINRWKRRQAITTGEPITVVDDQYPEADAARREFWQELEDALGSLPLDQKTVFVLAEIEQLPYAQIAAIEQTTLGTVKSRLHRAKQKLRQLLGAHTS